MIRYIIAAASMLCMLAAVFCFFLGYQYDHAGMGLNPLVSYPLGTLMIAAPFAAVATFSEE